MQRFYPKEIVWLLEKNIQERMMEIQRIDHAAVSGVQK